MVSRAAVEFSKAALFVHGLGERARPRALSGAPRARPVWGMRPACHRNKSGLRPHFFPTQPAGARAGAPECLRLVEPTDRRAGALPGTRALPRHWRGWDDRPRSSGSGQLRPGCVEPVAELGTSFDGGGCGLAECGRNFKCRAYRAGRAHSISCRVRMPGAGPAISKIAAAARTAKTKSPTAPPAPVLRSRPAKPASPSPPPLQKIRRTTP